MLAAKVLTANREVVIFPSLCVPSRPPLKIFPLEVICDGIDSSDNFDHFAAGHCSPVAAQPKLGIWTKRRYWSAVDNNIDSGVDEDYLELTSRPGALATVETISGARWATHA